MRDLGAIVAGELELFGTNILHVEADEHAEIAKHLCDTLVDELSVLTEMFGAENDADFLLILMKQHVRWIGFCRHVQKESDGCIVLSKNMFLDMFQDKWKQMDLKLSAEDRKTSEFLMKVVDKMRMIA